MQKPRSRSPAPSPQALRLDNQLCFALYSTMLGVNKVYRELLKDLELTYPQYLVMLVLWEQDGRTVSQIAQALYLDSPTLTPLLKRMETSGLLERQRSGQDERQVIINLTAAGRRLRERVLHIPGCVAAAIECAPAEIARLRTQLTQIRSMLFKETTTE